MTDSEFKAILYGWVDKVINIDGGLGKTIIFGEQNAPPPDPPYIVIHQPMNTTKVGRASKADETDDDGNLDILNLYEAVVSIEYVGGETDILRMIIESPEKQTIKDYLYSNGVSVLRNENINNIPDMTENYWELRTIVDIFVSYSSKTTEETNYIEDVELTNNII